MHYRCMSFTDILHIDTKGTCSYIKKRHKTTSLRMTIEFALNDIVCCCSSMQQSHEKRDHRSFWKHANVISWIRYQCYTTWTESNSIYNRRYLSGRSFQNRKVKWFFGVFQTEKKKTKEMQKFVVALKFTDAFVGNKKTEKQRKRWGKGRCRGILSFFYLSLCRLLWIVIHQTFQRTSLIYKYVKNHWRYISVFMKSDWYAIELAVSLHKLQTSLGKRRYHEARSILEDKQKKTIRIFVSHAATYSRSPRLHESWYAHYYTLLWPDVEKNCIFHSLHEIHYITKIYYVLLVRVIFYKRNCFVRIHGYIMKVHVLQQHFAQHFATLVVISVTIIFRYRFSPFFFWWNPNPELSWIGLFFIVHYFVDLNLSQICLSMFDITIDHFQTRPEGQEVRGQPETPCGRAGSYVYIYQGSSITDVFARRSPLHSHVCSLQNLVLRTYLSSPSFSLFSL